MMTPLSVDDEETAAAAAAAAGECCSDTSPSRTCAEIGLDHAQVSYTPFGFASILRVASGPGAMKMKIHTFRSLRHNCNV